MPDSIEVDIDPPTEFRLEEHVLGITNRFAEEFEEFEAEEFFSFFIILAWISGAV